MSSRKAFGELAAISSIPSDCRYRQPVSCTIRSRAKRLAVSTIILRASLEARKLKQGLEARAGVDRVGAAHRGVIELGDELEAGALSVADDRGALARLAVAVYVGRSRAASRRSYVARLATSRDASSAVSRGARGLEIRSHRCTRYDDGRAAGPPGP